MASPEPTDEELIQTIRGYNERSPDRWRAQFEMERRMAKRAAQEAGKATHRWTVIGAIAAIVAAAAGIIAIWPKK